MTPSHAEQVGGFLFWGPIGRRWFFSKGPSNDEALPEGGGMAAPGCLQLVKASRFFLCSGKNLVATATAADPRGGPGAIFRRFLCFL